MGRLTAQMQMYIAIGVMAVVTLAVVFLLILPIFQEVSSLNTEIATEQSNLAAAQALLARRQSAKAQSAANEVELMRIANQMPDAPQLPSVIIELQDVANAAGVEFRSITPSGITAVPATDGTTVAYDSLPMALVVDGSWAEVIDYLYRLQNLNRGVRVLSIAFVYNPGTAATETEGTETQAAETEAAVPPSITANVQLEAYMMPGTTSVVGAAVAPAAVPPATTTP
jgi:Tfp pilus assembly protein PilO